MNKLLAKSALLTGLITLPLTTNIDAKPQAYPSISRQNTEEVTKITKKDVLFTIDDGPSVYMLDIAKTLDSLHYEGIFYVVTRGVQKKREELIQVLKMGHHIGNHSFSHPNFQTLSFDQAKEQILVSDSLIASVYNEAGIPREKKYIRYPYGNQPPMYYREEFNNFLDSLGYETPMFRHMDVDLRDCASRPKDENIARMKQGDTILLHERSWTVESIQRIVQTIENKKVL